MVYRDVVWDPAKARANLAKHGVTFEEAMTVFADENARLIHDPDHSTDEDRSILLGLSEKPRLLVVVHTYRRGGTIRIVSARKATRSEHSLYRSFI